METQGSAKIAVNAELVRQLEMVAGAEFIHRAVNLISAYRGAIECVDRGDAQMADVAAEAEREMRKLLVKLRLRRMFFLQAFGPVRRA